MKFQLKSALKKLNYGTRSHLLNINLKYTVYLFLFIISLNKIKMLFIHRPNTMNVLKHSI